jgi:RNA polymerase sigma-70 factor (ECF subfamily)
MDSATSPTLLGRLRQQPADEAAWQEFVGRYGPRIHRWCRGWQLQDADAQDVTQIVLTRLAQRMQSFVYDPSRSFRGWLRTLAQHAWSDFVSAGQRGGRASGDSATFECLHSLQARDDLLTRLEAEFDHEILEEASARVQLRVEPDSWEAFRLITLEGLSGTEAAQRLGKEVSAVFKARSRVQALLRDEICKMEGDDP